MSGTVNALKVVRGGEAGTRELDCDDVLTTNTGGGGGNQQVFSRDGFRAAGNVTRA